MDKKQQTEIREYHRGYDDGKKGKSYKDGSDLFVAAVTLGLAGGPREGAKEYREGYRSGREDRKR